MLSERARRLAPSPTLAITARARALRAQGVEVISFGAGEPDFDTPERVKAAAVRAIAEGHTKYTDTAGIPELRAAVCAKLKRDNGLDYEPADVVVSVGAKHTLYNICAVLVGPGDEVLVPSPYWVSYTEQVRLCEGTPIPVPTDEARGFQLDLAALQSAVTPRTKLLVLNSPTNPTGSCFFNFDESTVSAHSFDWIATGLTSGQYVVTVNWSSSLGNTGISRALTCVGPVNLTVNQNKVFQFNKINSF